METEMSTTVKAVKPAKKKVKKAKEKRPNGRPLMYPDKTIVRMPKGFLARVNKALKVDEYQGDFMRVAVERELRARRK